MKDIVSYINEAANKELEKILDCKPKTLEGLQAKMLKYFKSCAGKGLRKIIGSKEAYLNPEDRKKLEKQYNIGLGNIKKVSIWFKVGKVAQAQLYIIELYNDDVVLGLRENSHIYTSTWCIIGSNNPYKYGTNFLEWLNNTYKDLGLTKENEAIFSMFGFTDKPKYEYN